MARPARSAPGLVWPAVVAVFMLVVRAKKRSSSSSASQGLRLAAVGLDIASFVREVTDVRSMAFSDNGSLALTGHWHAEAKLWDVERQEVHHTLDGHGGAVIAASFCEGGALAVTGSVDGTVILWDTASGRLIRSFTLGKNMVTSVACGSGFLGSSVSVLAGASGGAARLWDSASDDSLELDAPSGAGSGAVTVALGPGGASAMTAAPNGSATLWLWESAPGAAAGVCAAEAACIRPRGLPLRGHQGWLLAAAFGAGGKRLLTGSHDGTARVWDARTGRQLRLFSEALGSVSAVGFSADGRLAYAGDGVGIVHVWDCEGGEELRRFSSDGKIAALTAMPGRALVGVLRKKPPISKEEADAKCQAQCGAQDTQKAAKMPVFEVR